MESGRPTCKVHGDPIQLICQDCKELMCCWCTGPHFKNGCKGRAVDLASYAEQDLLLQLHDKLAEFESGKQKIEDSALGFAKAIPEIVKSLRGIKESTERRLAEINKTLAALEGCGPESAGSVYTTMKEDIEWYIEGLPFAAKNKNTDQIIKAIGAVQNCVGDIELQLVGDIITSANKVLIETKEFDILCENLKALVVKRQNVFKRNLMLGHEVTSKFVYGTCDKMGGYKKLCRYDIATNKIAQCINVPDNCSVLQIGKRIFVSGGSNPVSNTLSEFSEETQSLVGKLPMNYARYYHTAIAVSDDQFMTIGGYNGGAFFSCCEEYSIRDNTWKMISSLNQARCSAAAALFDDSAYLYVIGGVGNNNVIERMNMKEKRVWERVALCVAAEVPLNDYSAAFPISTDEIMLLVGSNKTDYGIYNIKAGTIKKHSQSLKPEYYYANGVCMIKRTAYIMGAYGHLHICKIVAKKIEEIDYSAAVSV
ncbi:MAG: kelch repeat-containing protein [Flavipsychrobacter sp.]|nr:kelch repeat-containing protein [Flavipsychrobacter sp.]